MFGNLIESGSHTGDLKRRGSFLLATIFFYAVLLAAAGVASIYAYDARLTDEHDLTLVSMMRFAPLAAAAEDLPRRAQTPAAAARSVRNEAAMRTKIVVNAPVVASRTVADDNPPEISPKQFVVIGTENRDPVGAGLPLGTEGAGNDVRPLSTGTARVGVPLDSVEPPPVPKPPVAAQPPPRPKTLALSHVINSKIIAKPVPVYPSIARAAGIHGAVAVQILVDESGQVVSAQATSGHALLQAEAVRAAYRARFTPTLLGNQPVKVTGVITYNFVFR